jgi:hypothetical protein
MAADIRDAAKGYVHRLLADAARPFRYRGGVRVLLGLPRVSDPQPSFSRPLPAADFACLLPRRGREEAELSEAFLDELRRAGEQVPEAGSSGQPSSALSPSPRAINAEVRPDAGSLEFVGRASATAQARVTRPSAVEAEVAPHVRAAQRQPAAAVVHGAGAMPIEEIVVPGRRQRADSSQSSPTASGAADTMAAQEALLWPDHAKAPDSTASAPDGRAMNSPLPSATAEPLPARRTVMQPTPAHELPGIAAPLSESMRNSSGVSFAARSLGATATPSPGEVASTFGVPPVADSARAPAGRPGPTRHAWRPSPSGSSSAPHPVAAQATSPLTPSDFRSPRHDRSPPWPFPAQESVPGGASSQSALAVPAGHTPLEPAVTHPVVVMQPTIDADMTPPAFWERRHLGHLQVRIRR